MKELTQSVAQEAMERLGSLRKAAKELGVHRDTLQRALAGKVVEQKATSRNLPAIQSDKVMMLNPNAITTVGKLREMLNLGNCILTPTSLTIGKDVSLVQSEKVLAQLVRVGDALPWWIGDLLAQSEILYGESYAQLVEPTAKNVQTLKDYHWVARAVKSSLRKDDLDYCHHKEVAKLEPKDQEKWLTLAIEHELSVRELRHSIANGKVMHIDEIEKLAGKGSGLKGIPCLHDVLEDFEKWYKKELPNGDDDLNSMGNDELLKSLEILRPVFAFYVKVEQALKKTVHTVEGVPA